MEVLTPIVLAGGGTGGGGGTPGGSDTQVQFNDGGAFGGDAGLTYDATNGSLSVGGKTVTASEPVLDLSQTWDNAATAFTGLKLNVTNTASAFGSNLLDLQVGGTSKTRIDTLGITYGVASAITTYIGLGALFGAYNGFKLYGDSTTLRFASNHTVGWTASTVEAFSTLDTALVRDSAGVVKITDGSTGTGYLRQVPVAVSALPAAATVGAGTRGFVSDANATTFASVVAGGGANVVPVYSDGTDWRIG